MDYRYHCLVTKMDISDGKMTDWQKLARILSRRLNLCLPIKPQQEKNKSDKMIKWLSGAARAMRWQVGLPFADERLKTSLICKLEPTFHRGLASWGVNRGANLAAAGMEVKTANLRLCCLPCCLVQTTDHIQRLLVLRADCWGLFCAP